MLKNGHALLRVTFDDQRDIAIIKNSFMSPLSHLIMFFFYILIDWAMLQRG